MPFIPHTEQDIKDMLEVIGVATTAQLFDEIPQELLCDDPDMLDDGVNEATICRELYQQARKDRQPLNFIGAGAYEHYIPAAVWEIVTRGEYYSAYTPYQAEASQGTLQTVYEFQSMIANLMSMDAANASLYDGASALAEAVLMAIRVNRKSKSKRVLVAATLSPRWKKVVQTIVKHQQIELIDVPYDVAIGRLDQQALQAHAGTDIAALIIPQPNFFGVLEVVDELTDWAHQQGALVIAAVNPLVMATIVPPGEWGEQGADIVCGEGQPLGVPLSSGGPYLGFMCCKTPYVRQMPGRIVGQTTDLDGKPGFTLTLQAREQHIRRSKATSNICTNQGLVMTAATVHMALLGDEGVRSAAAASYNNAQTLQKKITAIQGIKACFSGPTFHEFVLTFEKPVEEIIKKLEQQQIAAGYYLGDDYPQLKNSLLVCVTETKIAEDLQLFVDALQAAA